MFERLKKKTVTTKKGKNHFEFNFKKATSVGKLYLLHKIQKRLSNGKPRYFEMVHSQKKLQNS